ncbi:hypothetical protein L3Y34_010144 [Caenorhabditis briggsae]|uniref:Uncharacterized protein n=1 Tax=Caenorhabditis briggsae TaxID=6238 RepID=A0AAE9D2E8_CAEBR|nr:hypothetical protein L3Y34_010144 [Caenorhabditis briggsae]
MPETGIDRHDGTSSEEESDGEIVVTTRRKSFGIRVAQTPQQAAQQVLSQIGNMASERQANEVIVQQTQSTEKTEAEKKALENHQKMIEAQQLAKAQQAAALQAAAARVAQAQSQAQANQSQQQAQQAQSQQQAQQEAALKAAQEQAKKAQQEALARAQEAQKKAQEEALKKAQAAQQQAQAHAEAQKKAQQEALAKAQEAQKNALEDARKKAQAAQAEAQKKAQAQQQAQQQQMLAQKKAQEEAQKKAQEDAQKRAQAAQQQAQAQKKSQEEAQKKAQAQAQAQKQTQQAQQQKPAVPSQKTTPQAQQKPAVHVQQQAQQGQTQKGTLTQVQPVAQEIHAATGPKWSRTPGKVQTQGPQPEQPKQYTAVAPPTGKTALRQTVQVQEQDLAAGVHSTMSPVMARKPQIQADQLAQKFVEKPEEQKEKITVQKGQQLEGAKRWVADSEVREQPASNMQQTERGPKAVILADDACWQTQRRVPVEIQQPQVGKIAIPELSEKEIQRTIVAQPASYQKVQWNEFPEEPVYEREAAPKTKTQDWVPVNNEQNELQRSIYKPARMSAVWPPPQDELVKEGHSPLVVKANDDTAWIQQDQNGVLKQAVWGKTSRINRVWPPPENESSLTDFGPQHMPVVQWPPPEAEAHERELVEVLQKHIPTKKMERQWPPPPPQYQVVESSGEIETRYNPAETAESQQATGQQQVIRTVIRSQ